MEAQSGTGAPGLRIDVSGANDEGDFGLAIQLVVAMTLLTLGPSIIMMMTCFTRMIIVLGLFETQSESMLPFQSNYHRACFISDLFRDGAGMESYL